MFLYDAKNIRIYFGSANDQLYPDSYLNLAHIGSLISHPLFNKLKEILCLQHILFLRQMHGTKGLCIDNQAALLPSFYYEGDFLITNQKRFGIGIMTADCLPIIVYNENTNYIAIIHAGWRGSVAGIGVSAIQQLINTKKKNEYRIHIFFGPCAKVCCYEVKKTFIEEISQTSLDESCFEYRDNKIYFNLSYYNQLQIQQLGLNVTFNHTYNVCTICNNSYYSYRREGNNTGRQMTVVVLL